MIRLYFILSLCVVVSCNGDWLSCKPSEGCSIAKCDSKPGRRFGKRNKGVGVEFPILCQENGTEKSETAAKFDEIRSELKNLSAKFESSEAMRSEMKSEIDRLEVKNTAMESEIGGLGAKDNKLESEIDGLEKKNAEMESEIDGIKKEAEESKKKMNEQTAAKFDEIRKEIKNITGRLESSEAMRDEMKSEMHRLEMKNTAMESEIDGIKKEAEECKKKMNEQTAAKFDEIRMEIKNITGRLESSESMGDEMKLEIDGLKLKNAEMKSEIESLEMKNTAMESEIGGLGAKDNELESEIDGLEIKNTAMESEIDGLENNSTMLKSEIDRIENETKECKEKMNERITLLEQATNETLLQCYEYDNKCYLALLGSFDHAEGKAACKERGGHLANIYSQNHMDGVMKYIKDNLLGEDSSMDFRLGMPYYTAVKKLALRNGSNAPAGLKWAASYPKLAIPGDISTSLRVHRDPTGEDLQYLANGSMLSQTNILCEFE